jgi:hypothetical protein
VITLDEAIDAVDSFELMQYFSQMGTKARLKIAEELVAMINWPPNRPLTDGAGHVLPYIEPHVRLARLLRALKTVSVWTSMADIRALYCQMYKPADEIEPPVGCNIPGFTMEECEAGADFLSLERAESEQKFIPGPDDEPAKDFLLDISKAVKERFGDSEQKCSCKGEVVDPKCPVHSKGAAA